MKSLSAASSVASGASNSGLNGLEASKPCGSSRTNPTQPPSCDGTGPRPRYMLTLRSWIFTVFHEWTSSQGASPVRTSAMLERELASRGVVLASGRIVSKRLGRYDPGSHSLRTFQHSLIEDSTIALVTLPRSGMMRNGIVYRLPRLVRLTVVKELQSWPTPNCADAWTDKLESSQMKEGSRHSLTLGKAVKMWPTPTAGEYRHTGPKETAMNRQASTSRAVADSNRKEWVEGGGQLNPTWVEWLMGFPIEWTESNASGTQSCQPGRKQSGKQSKKE